MSGIDLGLEFGRRGTLENNHYQQNFFNAKELELVLLINGSRKEFTNKTEQYIYS